METVLVAIVVVFLILFATLTLSNAVFSTQDAMHVTWQETEARMQDQTRTQLSVVDTKTHAGTQVELTLRNTGSVKLADFDEWDVIVQYDDGTTPTGLHVDWVPYVATISGSDVWTIEGIYSNAALAVPEAFEKTILDPGEEAIVDVRVNPAIAAGSYVQMVVSAPNGATASTIFKRNVPPVLATNQSILVNNGESLDILKTDLETTDVDDVPGDLVYTVTTAPTQGTLSKGTTFTQEEINSGDLEYVNTGTSADSFQFTVSDGEDVIGPFTFGITVNLPPTLDVNTGMTVLVGMTGAIGDLNLKANDPDNTATELTYTVTTAPTVGNLSMTTFTQDDINNARLSYTHTGTNPEADSFAFTVSDGHKTIGPFTFAITAS